jgi:hypothetical protein
MPEFSVQSFVVSGASSAVGSTAADVMRARSGLTGTSGALAGTLAEGAHHGLVSAAVSVSAGFAEASHTLANALSTAAQAYVTAEESAAASLQKGRG